MSSTSVLYNCQCYAFNVKAADTRCTSAKLAAKVKAEKEEQLKAEQKRTPEKQKVFNLKFAIKLC